MEPTEEESPLTHIESLIATVRQRRAELHWAYMDLMKEDPPNIGRLDALAVERIQADKTLKALNIRMLNIVEALDY